jgi:hypothetical protein
MQIKKLAGVTRNAFALLLLTGALIAALPAYFAPDGYVARAACTKVGSASVDPDGIPRCDCTIVETSGNCACIVMCPPQND